ncbi:antitermination protein, partial [Xenorhabdus sp. SGI240]|uniref:antitermination protein Q n=1 Tax=Xenorhabdus sp. SGI240 TaxID=3158262 RepID=UPI0032B84B62
DCEDGFIEAEVFTTKTYTPWMARNLVKANLSMGVEIIPSSYAKFCEVREVVRVACPTCKGKSEVSHSCRCNGRGEVLDAKQTKLIGIPTYKTCPKCSGRGYSRLKFTDVWGEVKPLTGVSKTTCYDKYQPLFEHLVTECFKEEARADFILQKLTKREITSI